MRRSGYWLAMMLVMAGGLRALAQSTSVVDANAVPAWQTAAGGAMAFEVASVRLNPGKFTGPSFPLSSDDSFRETGGLFTADFPLSVYIEFAYKSRSDGEMHAMLNKLPKWVQTENYAINARAATANPTKDQMRLMMQALLRERFGLALHFEMREVPVLEMTLAKPGVTGVGLRPHSEGPACVETKEMPKMSDAKEGDAYPPVCDVYMLIPQPNNMMKLGSRNTTMELVVDAFGTIPNGLDRQVVDKTGLSGRYDFTLIWTRPQRNAPGAEAATDPQGTTFLEAVQEQLGVKLKSAKDMLRVMVVDHVERPTEN